MDGGKGEGGISAGTVREQRDTGQSDQLLCNMEKSAKEKVRQDGLMQEANGKGSNSDARKCRQGNVSQKGILGSRKLSLRMKCIQKLLVQKRKREKRLKSGKILAGN